MTTHDDSNSRGPNPKGQVEHDANWDSIAALTADGYWCSRCERHRVYATRGDEALCPSCRGDDTDAA